MSAKSRGPRLLRLHELVDQLGERDEKIKRDMRLFEEFFESFPIPVTLWSITREKAVVSQRGNGFCHGPAKSLDEMFECPVLRKESVSRHEEALQGAIVDYFIQSEQKVYFVKLVPRKNKQKEVSGVSGIAWDVTSNAVMLSCLEDIFTLTKGRRGQYKEINQISKRALNASRLKDMTGEGENDDG